LDETARRIIPMMDKKKKDGKMNDRGPHCLPSGGEGKLNVDRAGGRCSDRSLRIRQVKRGPGTFPIEGRGLTGCAKEGES